MEIDNEQADVHVKFMHPQGPARSFHWPDWDDICWVPMVHILDKIDALYFGNITTVTLDVASSQDRIGQKTQRRKNSKIFCLSQTLSYSTNSYYLN